MFTEIKIGRIACLVLALAAQHKATAAQDKDGKPEIIHFRSAGLPLGGELFKPPGAGPFPAVLYNHGSAPGMLNSQVSAAIGPLFARAGWVFFMPYRRGQGLSAAAGPYVLDQVAAARERGGSRAASAELTRLLATGQLQDQLGALAWLGSQPFVQRGRIAAAGNSFGGIQAILGSAHAPYCAVVAASAASESWEGAPDLRQLLTDAVSRSNVPMLFFQAENDFSLSPNRALVEVRKREGKPVVSKLYPAFGSSAREGHAFAYMGAGVWFPDVLKFLEHHCPE